MNTMDVTVQGDATGGWIVECRTADHHDCFSPEAATAEEAADKARQLFADKNAPKPSPEEEHLANLQALLDDMNATVARQTDHIGKLEASEAQLQQSLAEKETQIAAMTTERQVLTQRVDDLTVRLAATPPVNPHTGPVPQPEPQPAAQSPTEPPTPSA